MKRRTIHSHHGRGIAAVEVEQAAGLDALQQNLKLPPVRGAIALVGGANGFDEPQYKRIQQQVAKHFAELTVLATDFSLAIVDGGTQAGAMRLIGQEYQRHRADFPLIGVAPKGQVAWQTYRPPTWIQRFLGETTEKTSLEKSHSAFVLVNTDKWGGEVETLADVAHYLGSQRTLQILINGGDISKQDVIAFLKRGGQVLVLEGTGRLADEIATAVRLGTTQDDTIQQIIQTGRVHLFSIHETPAAFELQLRHLLGLSGERRIFKTS